MNKGCISVEGTQQGVESGGLGLVGDNINNDYESLALWWVIEGYLAC